MAQIFHVNKSMIPLIVRNYGTYGPNQRSRNYYDILCISPNATQKEIKDAYLKLSKKMHPDVGNKGSHSDFVKINEAYSTLSKKDKKWEYDMRLKYHNVSYNQNRYHQYNYYQHSTAGYDFERAGGIKHSKQEVAIVVVCIIVSYLYLFHTICRTSGAIYNRKMMQEKTARQLREYEMIKENAKNKTFDEQIQDVVDLYETHKFDSRDK